MNGGGFPMRFADIDGTPIDVYQQNTNMTDEATSATGARSTRCSTTRSARTGYYGAFGINMHTDNPGAPRRRRGSRRVRPGARRAR